MYQQAQNVSISSIGPQDQGCRPPEILEQMERMRGAVGELEGYFSAIEDKFAPILQVTPAPTNSALLKDVSSYHSGMGAEIGAVVERMQSLLGRAASILQRAEL